MTAAVAAVVRVGPAGRVVTDLPVVRRAAIVPVVCAAKVALVAVQVSAVAIAAVDLAVRAGMTVASNARLRPRRCRS